VQLDGRNPYSHYALAIISVFSEQFHQAIGAARKAIDINPTFALGHMVLGMGLLFDGHAAEAIAPLERGLRLNPNDPQNFVWFNLLALARLFSGDPEAALESARQALHARPDWWTSMEVMLCCHAALGNWDEAKQYGRRLANIGPRSGDVIAPLRARNPEWARQISSFVRQASD
jgi:tetratricopeptide (TPR) repeat protein